ncbi:MAG TPA: hypothetical protein VNF27_09720 [Candidatus Binataceae bacterium]|nr:hypothetical protein [Candidatus Binataceae bacterium]
MPCCAFAVFIISQIVLSYGAIKRFLLRSGDSLDDLPSNPATEWRLNAATPALAAGSNRRFGLRTLVLAASIETLLAVGAIYGYSLHAHHHHHDLASVAGAPASVCVR